MQISVDSGVVHTCGTTHLGDEDAPFQHAAVFLMKNSYIPTTEDPMDVYYYDYGRDNGVAIGTVTGNVLKRELPFTEEE